MEDEVVNQFRGRILQGQYFNQKQEDTDINLLRQIAISHESQKRIEFMLYEQNYLELMEQGSKIEAILILQRELVPRCEND